MRTPLLVTLALLLLTPASLADDGAALEDFAWMAGRWRGEFAGGVAEHHFSEPAGGAMVAWFRLIQGDDTAVFELATLSEEDDGLTLRFRHFSPTLEAWEPQDEPVSLTFNGWDGDAAVFVNADPTGNPRKSAITRLDDDRMRLSSEIIDANREAQTMAFETVRQTEARIGAEDDGGQTLPLTIGSLGWMAGRWEGEALGGRVEEWWSAPEAGTMLGMFRLSRDGKTAVTEYLLIEETADAVTLRFKHFNNDFTTWEQGDPLTFRLESARPGFARFVSDTQTKPERLTYRLAPDGALSIVVEGRATPEAELESFEVRVRRAH